MMVCLFSVGELVREDWPPSPLFTEKNVTRVNVPTSHFSIMASPLLQEFMCPLKG